MQSKDLKFVLVLLAGSLCLNVILGWRLRENEIAGSVAAKSAETIVGVVLSDLRVLDVSGNPETLYFVGQDKPTILYVLSPTCRWCDRNMDNIRTLASAKGESFRMLGLSLTQFELQAYVQRHGIDFPMYVIGDMESVRSLDLGSTPLTLVVSSDGKIEKNWIGAFSQLVAAKVSAGTFDPHPPNDHYIDSIFLLDSQTGRVWKYQGAEALGEGVLIPELFDSVFIDELGGETTLQFFERLSKSQEKKLKPRPKP